MDKKDKKAKKVTLTAEEFRIVFTAASLGIYAACQDNQEMTQMAKRGQIILNKICEIIDSDNKTFDLIAR